MSAGNTLGGVKRKCLPLQLFIRLFFTDFSSNFRYYKIQDTNSAENCSRHFNCLFSPKFTISNVKMMHWSHIRQPLKKQIAIE